MLIFSGKAERAGRIVGVRAARAIVGVRAARAIVGRVRRVGQVRLVGQVRVRAARAIVGQVRRVSCTGDCGTSGGVKKRFLFVGLKITLIFVAVKINI